MTIDISGRLKPLFVAGVALFGATAYQPAAAQSITVRRKCSISSAPAVFPAPF